MCVTEVQGNVPHYSLVKRSFLCHRNSFFSLLLKNIGVWNFIFNPGTLINLAAAVQLGLQGQLQELPKSGPVAIISLA